MKLRTPSLLEVGGPLQLVDRLTQIFQLAGKDGLRIIDTAVVEVRTDFFGKEIEQELGIETPDLLFGSSVKYSWILRVIAARSLSVNLMFIGIV